MTIRTEDFCRECRDNVGKLLRVEHLDIKILRATVLELLKTAYIIDEFSHGYEEVVDVRKIKEAFPFIVDEAKLSKKNDREWGANPHSSTSYPQQEKKR